ncbi:MAG: response regulator transcription factor [Deltaproteobacteria bacterium]|nr:response regulator transcription factor [Deltaproteobacteria bacterium]MBW2081343.1 response regulator transcription factor [Deltaproteobacteria bacterium]MBW2351280.1 response regulator transcription factor [Deltaproteobacteria bacterium]
MMGPDSKIRIVVVEDHRLFREGLRLILNGEKSFEIVGEAANGLQAIDLISGLKPYVVLLDITMPELSGIDIIPLIKQKSPGTKALMLTASKDETKIFKSLKAGARGYLTKNTTILELTKAIKVVNKGQLWIERKLFARYFNGDITSDIGREGRQEKLTPREQDVLHLLIKGFTNKEIANDLFISEKTIKSHLNKIFKKLNVSRRLGAILTAIKLGFA